jgi:uncharacterized damage-inducible protein DinB
MEDSMARQETARIADQIHRAVHGPAWHGASLLEAVHGVTAAQAHSRPVPGAHSIRELVVHATAWLDIARQRVEGTAPGRITAAMDWPPLARGPEAWRRDVAGLRRTAASLVATVRRIDDARLEDELPGTADTWTAYVTLLGVVQHVAYHAGQIALLKKGAPERRRAVAD